MKPFITAFLPVRSKTAYRPAVLPLREPPRRPFITAAESAEGIVIRFLTAVWQKDAMAAKRFLSRRFLAGELTDIDNLQRAMDGQSQAKWVRRISVRRGQNGALTHADVLLVTKEVLSLHLIREPDRVSAWKIYAIERE